MKFYFATHSIDLKQRCTAMITEPFCSDDSRCKTIGLLYKAMLKEHGRCTGRMYVDSPEGPKAIGWCFLRRRKYDDCAETYLCETWVTLYHEPPDDLLDLDHPNDVPSDMRLATELSARATYAGVESDKVHGEGRS